MDVFAEVKKKAQGPALQYAIFNNSITYTKQTLPVYVRKTNITSIRTDNNFHLCFNRFKFPVVTLFINTGLHQKK